MSDRAIPTRTRLSQTPSEENTLESDKVTFEVWLERLLAHTKGEAGKNEYTT